MISMMIGIVVFSLIMALIVPFHIVWRDTTPATKNMGTPYRTPAPMPTPVFQPEPTPKKDFKMPTLNKHTKTFAYILGACASITGIGAIHDAKFLGEGIQYGSGISLGLIAALMLIMALHNATDGFQS